MSIRWPRLGIVKSRAQRRRSRRGSALNPFSLSGCCCGACAIYSNNLKGGSLPSGLSISSGSWTWAGSGARTNSVNAKIMCSVLPPARYFGVSPSVTVANANAGDVAILYFNGGWQARLTFDDGSGTVGKAEVYDGSGALMTSTPSSAVGTATLSLCLAKAVNPDDDSLGTDHGSSVTGFAYGSYIDSVTTLAIGFGTGGTNTGGLTFSDFSLTKTDYTDTSGNLADDPDSCGSCGCPAAAAADTAEAMQAREFTLDIAGSTQQPDTCVTCDGSPNYCDDCSKYNTSLVATYLAGAANDLGGSWQYDSGVVNLGASCGINAPAPVTARLQVTVAPRCEVSGPAFPHCASQICVIITLNGACSVACLPGPTPGGAGGDFSAAGNTPSLPPFSAANLAAINTALATLVASIGGLPGVCSADGGSGAMTLVCS